MKKGQVFDGGIEKVAFPNKGHITVDGKTVIVKNGVPGQKVRFSVNKVRSGRAEGRILEVLEKSPLECRYVRILPTAVDVLIRISLMRSSLP